MSRIPPPCARVTTGKKPAARTRRKKKSTAGVAHCTVRERVVLCESDPLIFIKPALIASPRDFGSFSTEKPVLGRLGRFRGAEQNAGSYRRDVVNRTDLENSSNRSTTEKGFSNEEDTGSLDIVSCCLCVRRCKRQEIR